MIGENDMDEFISRQHEVIVGSCDGVGDIRLRVPNLLNTSDQAPPTFKPFLILEP